MDLPGKIERTQGIIRLMLESSRRPALMCSFGKDSMVMLDVLTRMGLELPVVYYRADNDPIKHRFADEIIREWLLEVYDYAPSGVSLAEGNGDINIVYHYQIGPTKQSILALPKNVQHGVRCGKELLQRPTGTFNYPWDAVLIGHKSTDSDNVAGSLELHTDVKQNAGIAPDAWFPLRFWTDEDIWAYTRAYDVPQQPDRYDVGAGTELQDKSANSDYITACVACMDRREKGSCVYCPKLGLQVSTISHLVPYTDTKLNYFGRN